ncbi:Ig-like domain repeat protein [uncultured Methanobrevibacter sp.]|uniref:Ig-like domain repeat protein n=1 Tax=uncultured Methanobrevibacter sp. TaxID=253161 RepID=UPI002600741B|nr:Ig-like domain repeat protein [uncultured Methanobrevibacter sp.]
MKYYELIILVICLIMGISTVSAGNVNSSDDFVSDYGSEILSDDVITDEIGDIEYSSNQTIDISDSECCSFVIQENDGQTVYAFRQDSPLNGYGVKINSQDWYDRNVIKQEIDTPDSYFFHSIITEDGWVIGQGGSQYDEDSRAIERIAGTIVSNNDISPNYLEQVRNILYGYNYGHFFIKAPDGSYGIAFFDRYFTGTLYPGQYMIIPNYFKYYDKGNYMDYSQNPVDAIIRICSYDYSGLNRRNLYTYEYKVFDTPNGVFNGVNVYVTNDNGHNVGLDTSKIVTHFYYEGSYYPASSVPENPGKLYVGTHLFENTATGMMIDLVENINNVIINEESSVTYMIKLLNNEHVVVFNLGNGVDFVRASTSHGFSSYDANEHILYWHLPAVNEIKEITIIFKPKTLGNQNIHTYVQDKAEENDFNYYVTEYGAYISADNVTKYVGGNQRLNVYLNDKFDHPLVGENVDILINGQWYSRTVSNNGYASLAINLGPGQYDVVVFYDGQMGNNQSMAKVVVKPNVFAEDIVKYFKNDTQFYATFLDANGKLLKNTNVLFNINGVFYTRTTDDEGIAKLNINLQPGNYIITSINSATGDQIGNTITVKTVIVENNDIVKYYKNDTQYTIKVLDGQGKPSSGKNVTFNINGVFYTRTTDDEGIAKLNINLIPGDYIITVNYNGQYACNDIMVLETLVTQDLSMNYRDGSKFKVFVLDKQGRPLKGENVIFNINGVFYNRTTDENGMAALSINLISGIYIITSCWDDYSVANTIKIS